MGSKAAPNPELVARTRWYIRLRWYLIAGITLPTLSSLYIGRGMKSDQTAGLIFTVVLFAVNGIFYGLVRLKRGHDYHRLLAMSLLAFDVLLISALIFARGGVESRALLFYTVPILMSALFFGRAGVYTTGAGAAVVYDLVILGNYFGWFHSGDVATHEGTDAGYVLYSFVFYNAGVIMVAVLTDLLTRTLIQKEREATTAAAALRRAQEIAKIGSWEWDMETDRYKFSDEAYKALGGVYASETATSKDLVRNIHPDDRERVSEIMAKARQTGKPFSFEHRLLLPDKTVRVVRTEGEPMKNKRGRVVGIFGTTQDITAERALDEAKGDFVALASHQLRTPASGVRMLLGMLRENYAGELTPEQKRIADDAYAANEQLLHISEDLLTVAKLEAGRLKLNKQQIELCRWLKDIVRQQKLLAREQRQRMLLDVPKGKVFLYGDASRLAKVLDNLLSNARKYTPARGRILVSLQPGRNKHKIIISDTGNGMTKTELSKLFGKFTRIDNPASKGIEGTGLGLYMAKSIVDLHGGSIRVRSKPEQGSTFTITLPVAA